MPNTITRPAIILFCSLSIGGCQSNGGPSSTAVPSVDVSVIPTAQCEQVSQTGQDMRSIIIDFSDEVPTNHLGAGGNTTSCPSLVREAMVSPARRFCEEGLEEAHIDYVAVQARGVDEMDCNCDGGPGSCYVKAQLTCETLVRTTPDQSLVCLR